MAEPLDHERAAERIYLLILNLRRRNEAWADGDREFAIDNPDVAAYDRDLMDAPLTNERSRLIRTIAAIIAQEWEKATAESVKQSSDMH